MVLGREAATERNEDISHIARSSGMRDQEGCRRSSVLGGEAGLSENKKVKGTFGEG